MAQQQQQQHSALRRPKHSSEYRGSTSGELTANSGEASFPRGTHSALLGPKHASADRATTKQCERELEVRAGNRLGHALALPCKREPQWLRRPKHSSEYREGRIREK